MSTMVIERALLEQALEALQWHYRQGHSNTLGGFRLKIDEKALRELSAALAQRAEPVERAMQDAVTTGMGIMRGGERIDPSTIYKPIEGVPV